MVQHIKQNASPKILFIQMEYCEKSTLRALIDSSRLYKNPRTIWRIFREILLGLQYIHKEGMIHRDIKPVIFWMNLLYIHGNLSKKVMQFFTFMRICYYICNICRFILFLEFYFIIKNLTNLKFNLKIIKLLIIKLILF